MSQTPPPPPPPAAATGRGQVGEIRSPLAVLLLSIITCGIYGIYWYYKTFQEMKDHSGEGIGGGLALVFAFVCGPVLIFLLPSEVGNLYARDSKEKPVSGTTGFWVLLPLVGSIVWIFKVQGALNEYWASKGATKK